MDSVNTPVGTGVFDRDMYATAGFGRGRLFRDEVQSPDVGGLGTPRACSSRVQFPPSLSPSEQRTTSASSDDVRALITELASQIGQSIADQLQRNSDVTAHDTSVKKGGSQPEQQPTEFNLSVVRLVMQSDAKEPPIYRGDSSDKCSVREWVEMVGAYFRKSNVPVHLQLQEILAKLRGKARDVVRVTLRHNSDATPDFVYDILKQHFSELTYSSMPMADFYNTRPLRDEGVMDYWIRLNNAIDIADECLKRQKRSVEDPGREVCMMFIKFCPDPILSNRLSFKAAEEWTTSEVQERIDAYQRELRMRTLTSSHTPQRHIVTHTQSAMSREPELSQPAPAEPQFQLPFSQGFVPPQATMFANASVQTPTSQLSPLAEQFVPNSPAVHLPQPSHAQSVPQYAQSPACFQAHQSSHAPPATATVGVNSMNALISLLDHLVVRQNVQAPAQEPSYAPMPFQRRSCRVCDDVRHSTLAHCRRENLCLACFAPGHWKKDCDKYGRKRVGQADARRGPPAGN